VETDEVDFKQLMKWRIERLRGNNGMLPVAERVFANLVGRKTYEIYGVGDFRGRIYHLNYALDMSDVKITVAKEKDLIKNEIIGYWYERV
jgi:hypothetical protein